MQQHRQLSCGGDDGSLLSALSATLGQLQSPASQVTVDAERPQDVLRSLHQQRSQIGVSLFADMHLRLAPPRVSSSWLQSQIAAHVAALAEAMRIFQRQHVRHRDQRAHTLDLLQQRRLRIILLRQLSRCAGCIRAICSLSDFDRGQQRLQRALAVPDSVPPLSPDSYCARCSRAIFRRKTSPARVPY